MSSKIDLDSLTELSVEDIAWIEPESVIGVDTINHCVGFRFPNGALYKVSLPPILMNAIVDHVEKKMIDEDLERSDEKYGLY